MGNTLLVMRGRLTLRVPSLLWKWSVLSEARHATARLEFMGPEHHRVRNYVVTELRQHPLSVDTIAEGVELEAKRVRGILDDLETHLTFLYRSDGHNVDWAYPVTAENTPHQVTVDNGERFFAA